MWQMPNPSNQRINSLTIFVLVLIVQFFPHLEDHLSGQTYTYFYIKLQVYWSIDMSSSQPWGRSSYLWSSNQPLVRIKALSSVGWLCLIVNLAQPRITRFLIKNYPYRIRYIQYRYVVKSLGILYIKLFDMERQAYCGQQHHSLGWYS